MGGTQITFRRLRRVPGDSRGAAAVELGLVIGILMMLLFGIIEFGLVLNRYISVTQASREGARQMSVGVLQADAETNAVLTTPELIDKVVCTGSTSDDGGDVTMTCTTEYDLSLWVVRKPMTLTSTSTMRKEG